MSRLIDADDRKLRAELVYYTCWTGIDEAPYLFAVNVLDKAPTVDAVPVIRCKDCEHTYLSDNFGITAPWLMCKRHIGNTYKVNEDDFCSLAERKEE